MGNGQNALGSSLLSDVFDEVEASRETVVVDERLPLLPLSNAVGPGYERGHVGELAEPVKLLKGLAKAVLNSLFRIIE